MGREIGRDRQADKQIDGWIVRRTETQDGRPGENTCMISARCAGLNNRRRRETDRQIDRWTDRQTDKQADRQRENVCMYNPARCAGLNKGGCREPE